MVGALRECAERLAVAGVERPRWEAEQIAAAVIGCEPIAFVVEAPVMRPGQGEEIRRRVERRAAGEPLQYVTGLAGFFGHDFRVGPGIFIPRPETERLVEVTLREIAGLPVRHPVIVDVGTGSGAIAISLTLTSSVGTIHGFELSPLAMAGARENAVRLGVSERIRWIHTDLLTSCAADRVDLIVANLPYVPTLAIPSLPQDVRHDPLVALDGGLDGLLVIRRLLRQATACLRPHGIVVLEVGEGQAAQLRREFDTAWAACEVVRDDPGVERVIVFRRPKRGVRG